VVWIPDCRMAANLEERCRRDAVVEDVMYSMETKAFFDLCKRVPDSVQQDDNEEHELGQERHEIDHRRWRRRVTITQLCRLFPSLLAQLAHVCPYAAASGRRDCRA
jgi:hypothetical protein